MTFFWPSPNHDRLPANHCCSALNRPQVNVQTKVQLNLSRSVVKNVADITPESLNGVFNFLRSTSRGSALRAERERLTPVQLDLLKGFKSVSNRVPGTPQSLLRLRSELWGYYDVAQTFSMNITLNPKDLDADIVFEMAGMKYGFKPGPWGEPDQDRPGSAARYKAIAANPHACAHFFELYINAFVSVFLGWDEGGRAQARPDWCACVLPSEASGCSLYVTGPPPDRNATSDRSVGFRRG